MVQLDLYEAKPKPITGQKQRILTRLREGPAMNWELSQIALKYTNRITELRRLGYDIEVERIGTSGTFRYELRKG